MLMACLWFKSFGCKVSRSYIQKSSLALRSLGSRWSMIWALCLKTPYSYTSPYFPIQLYIRSILVTSEYKFFVIVDPTYYFWHTLNVSKYSTLILLQSCYYKTIVCIVFIEILSRSPFLKIWSEGHPPPRYIYILYMHLWKLAKLVTLSA